MWQELLSGIPRPLILSAVIYAATSWLVTGPLVAERTAQTRYYPACVAGEAAQPLAKNPQEQLLDELRKSPWLDAPTLRLFGLDRYFELVRPQTGRARSSSSPEAKCRCLIDQAIARSQTAWALYAGSLRLIARPEVSRFDALIARISQEGACHE